MAAERYVTMMRTAHLRLLTLIWPLFLAWTLFGSGAYALIVDLVRIGAVHVPLLPPWLDPLYVQVLASVAAVLFAFRVLPAVTGPLFLAGFLYLCGVLYQASGSYGHWAFYTLPLLILVLYNALRSSADPEKCHRLLVGAYVLFYASAGIAKLFPLWHGIEWLKGHTIENLLAQRKAGSILWELGGMDVTAMPPLLMKFGVVVSVLLELSALLILFDIRWSRVVVPLLLLFHAVLYLTGTPGLVEYTVAALIFLPLAIVRELHGGMASFRSIFVRYANV